MIVRYFFAWTPLVIFGTVVLLSLPWLGLIALMVFALVALAAVASGIVFVPYMVGRAFSHRRRMHGGASPERAAAPSLAERQDA
jgi:hypothetical protein